MSYFALLFIFSCITCSWNRAKLSLAQRKAKIKQKKEAFLRQQIKQEDTIDDDEEED